MSGNPSVGPDGMGPGGLCRCGQTARLVGGFMLCPRCDAPDREPAVVGAEPACTGTRPHPLISRVSECPGTRNVNYPEPTKGGPP